MRRTVFFLAALTLACTASQPVLTGAPQPTATPAAATAAPATAPTVSTSAVSPEEEKHLAELREAIKGKESLPASQVFKNVKLLGNLPAERLLRVMQFGYSRSLGVTCTHCHTPGLWEDDSKQAKRVTRKMNEMVTQINREILPKIEDFETRRPVVNCTTCHRGKTKPATEM